MAQIQIAGFRCERCDHTWAPKRGTQQPVVCPKCKSPYWNRARKPKALSTGRRPARRSGPS